MDREYDALPIRELGTGAGLSPADAGGGGEGVDGLARARGHDRPDARHAGDHPAAGAARRRQPIHDRARGVRLLLVVDDHAVLGLITATDLLGERPIQVAIERGLRRDDLTVGDIMIDAEHVECSRSPKSKPRVGHVVETLRRAGRQHALVVDAERMVRGIFSLTQIARQLGVAVPSPPAR